MKCKGNIRSKIAICFLAVAIILGVSVMGASDAYANDIWVTAYYGGWEQGDVNWTGHMSADKIDYSAVTHIIHFAIQPKSDGTIDFNTLYITPANSASLVKNAKAAGKKVLLSLGGAYTENAFLGATSDANRQKFINNIINFMVTRGYDGIDFNWEPISSSSVSRVRTFVNELRAALDTINPRPLLTAAVAWEAGLFAQLQDKFDQINVMTYDLNGDWLNGSWFNAPTYDGGYYFPSSGPAPSADNFVGTFISAGVKPAKLGIGIGFYGYVAKGGSGTPTGGVTAPGQKWTTPPTKTMYSYYELMDKFYKTANYRYDSAAGAPYLSYDMAASSEDMFITYDDEASIYEKIKYVRNKAIGGIIIFQLGGGWRPSSPNPDSLLQSVKSSVLSTQNQNVVPSAPTLNSPASGAVGISTSTTVKWNSSTGASSYALQVSKNAAFTEIVIHTDVTATSYNLTGLNENTTYHWRVLAKNANGSSGWSNAWSFTTAAALKTVIANFTATPVSAGVLLTWQTVTENNNKGFDIERRLSTSTRWAKVSYVAGAGTSTTPKNYSFTDSRIRTGRAYIYRLKQINADASFTYSSEVTVLK